jgi:hypothetical protein
LPATRCVKGHDSGLLGSRFSPTAMGWRPGRIDSRQLSLGCCRLLRQETNGEHRVRGSERNFCQVEGI